MSVTLELTSEAWGNFCYDLGWNRFRQGIRDFDRSAEKTQQLYNEGLDKFRGWVTADGDFWVVNFPTENDRFLFELAWIGKDNGRHRYN
jgi:hypothetical protein